MTRTEASLTEIRQRLSALRARAEGGDEFVPAAAPDPRCALFVEPRVESHDTYRIPFPERLRLAAFRRGGHDLGLPHAFGNSQLRAVGSRHQA